MSDSTPTPDPTKPIGGSSTADLPRITATLRTTYHCFTLFSPSDGPSTLERLLLERLPNISRDSWPERFAFGGVYVNGVEALGDQPLPIPCKVEYYEPKFAISEASSVFPKFEERFVVFRDDAIAIVYKPPRLSSMPAKEQRHFSLKASLEALFKTQVHMPSRLDVSAQGLVVVSLHPSAHAKLQQAFETRTVHKTYYFATASRVDWERVSVDLPIFRDPQHAVLRSVKPNGEAGQAALTHFTFSHVGQSEGTAVSVVRAEPVTGRTHQIRVHAASQSAPILGDNFYGGSPASILHLASHSISLPHPLTGGRISAVLPTALRPSWCPLG